MAQSRVNKYKDLREGIKEEVGINRDNTDVNTDSVEEKQDDDFLSFVNRGATQEHENAIDDTLAEALTFEQMKEQSNAEIERALRNAKAGVGKEERYNTRMDILNKIRDTDANKIKIDAVDQYQTSDFSKGMLLNQEPAQEEEEPVIDENSEKYKNMTLMERLAQMSPKEDAQKVQEVIEEEPKVEEIEDVEEPIEEPQTIEPENQKEALGDMLEKIREKDRQEVKKQTGIELEKPDTQLYDNLQDEQDSSKVVTILNYVIVALIIVLIILFAVIVYQSFF